MGDHLEEVFYELLRACWSVLHVVSPFAQEALVCCSFPLATVVVLFAERYKAVESEAASVLLLSTVALGHHCADDSVVE